MEKREVQRFEEEFTPILSPPNSPAERSKENIDSVLRRKHIVTASDPCLRQTLGVFLFWRSSALAQPFCLA
jgi:hypothetical protein